MNRIARMAKVQANKVNANCNFLFDACNKLISLPCVFVIAKKPVPAFCNAREVSADKIINAILIKTAACPGAFSTTYKFEIANTARPAAAQLLFFARREKCEDCSELNSYSERVILG